MRRLVACHGGVDRADKEIYKHVFGSLVPVQGPKTHPVGMIRAKV